MSALVATVKSATVPEGGLVTPTIVIVMESPALTLKPVANGMTTPLSSLVAAPVGRWVPGRVREAVGDEVPARRRVRDQRAAFGRKNWWGRPAH